MFSNFTWKKFVVILLVVLGMTGAAFAVKYGEDGQVGSDNVLSTWLFIMTGFVAFYDLLVLMIVLRKLRIRGRDSR